MLISTNSSIFHGIFHYKHHPFYGYHFCKNLYISTINGWFIMFIVEHLMKNGWNSWKMVGLFRGKSRMKKWKDMKIWSTPSQLKKPSMVGLFHGKSPSKNGWWLGFTPQPPFYGNLQEPPGYPVPAPHTVQTQRTVRRWSAMCPRGRRPGAALRLGSSWKWWINKLSQIYLVI